MFGAGVPLTERPATFRPTNFVPAALTLKAPVPEFLAVVLTGVSGRRARALVAWLGAAASAVGMILLYSPGADPSRVYYGTDTHATALLVGCAIALTWPLASLT